MGSFRFWVVLTLLAAVQAQAADISLRWDDLKPLATGERIEVFTPAATFKGRCTAITATAVTVGKRDVPRSDVQRLRVIRHVGNKRKMGAGIGFVSGMVAGLVALVAIGMDESGTEGKAVLTA